MSAYINEITVMGNLGKDPELRYFANGTASLRISIATPDQWTDKETGEVKESTQWHTASLLGNQAEIVAKYMKKGDKDLGFVARCKQRFTRMNAPEWIAYLSWSKFRI
uniref:Single-stranded DNA-binding protein n=1 Tax=Advenella mimigardefordensis TaxID=302406 RepID=B4YK41_9BURK|nr:Ssb [Advenella kashmirensis]